MKRLILLGILFGFHAAHAQKMVPNTVPYDISESISPDPSMAKHHYTVREQVECLSATFNKNACTCKKREVYNDSGRPVTLVTGANLYENKIDYTIHYLSTVDTLSELTTRFSAHYIDSTRLFRYDTIKNGQQEHEMIYPREANGDVVIRSVVKGQTEQGLPREIYRYDKNGHLQEIYYPLGNRKSLHEWTDTATSKKRRTVTYNAIYPENEYYSSTIYGPSGKALEDSYYNRSYDGAEATEKRIFIYNRDNKLASLLTVSEDNVLNGRKDYFYKNDILVKYTAFAGVEDTTGYERRLYDEQGRMTESWSRSSGVIPARNWLFKYFYKDGLLDRSDFYYNGTFEKSTFYMYK